MARGADNSWLWLVGGAAALAYFASQHAAGGGASAPGIPFYSTTATPLSVYPEYGYTAQTSMASTGAQKAPAAVTPTNYFTSVQQQEMSALLSQCVGAYPGCTPMLGDSQLGF